MRYSFNYAHRISTQFRSDSINFSRLPITTHQAQKKGLIPFGYKPRFNTNCTTNYVILTAISLLCWWMQTNIIEE